MKPVFEKIVVMFAFFLFAGVTVVLVAKNAPPVGIQLQLSSNSLVQSNSMVRSITATSAADRVNNQEAGKKK